ncbi:amino acid ABC transporter permease [Alicyclobacillaceae bacterium I2511]|nr:amino acid ABC transporter permease [Alicyclobacillaceae bacterium I2511]
MMNWFTPIDNFGFLFMGTVNTFWITVVSFVLSFLFGSLLATARYYKNIKSTYTLSTIYVEVIRNTPVLVQIYLIYFGLAEFGIHLIAVVAGILALAINNAAYLSEIIRAGIVAVQNGQWEAASTLGLSTWQILYRVIFPQAIRNTFPAIANQFIAIIYGTSLLSVLDVRELMDRANILNSQTFQSMPIFVFVTLLYYVVSIFVSFFLKWVNRRYFPSVQKG